MENKNAVKFRDVDNSLPYLPRTVYDLVRSHIIGSRLLNDNTISRLDYLIASTHKKQLFDLSLSIDDLHSIVGRLPVLVAAGGYHVAKPPPKLGRLSAACVPTPVTPAHLGRICDALRIAASQLGTPLHGLDDLKEMIDIVFESGVSSNKFVERSDPETSNVEYHDDDPSVQTFEGVMGKKTNRGLLEELFSGWIRLRVNLLTSVKMNKDKTVSLEIVKSDDFVNPILIPAGCLVEGKTLPELEKRLRADYEVIASRTAQDAYKLAYGRFIRMLQTEYELNFGSHAPNLTVPQIKLFCMLRVMVAVHNKSIRDYCKSVRVLDLCSDPSAMATMLINLGSVVYVQTLKDTEGTSLTRCQTIPPWFTICGPYDDIGYWHSNVTDHSDDHSFDLIIADGYYESGDQFNQNHVNLFWTEVFVALFKLQYGGTLIIKFVSPWNELFANCINAPNSGAYDSHVMDFIQNHPLRCQLFSRFSHSTIIKPLGSTPHNYERYLVLIGYRSLPLDESNIDVTNVAAMFSNFEARYSAVIISLIKAARTTSNKPVVAPTDFRDFLVKQISPKFDQPLYGEREYSSQIMNALMSKLKPKSIMQVSPSSESIKAALLNWNLIYTNAGVYREKTADNEWDETKVNFPDGLTTISAAGPVRTSLLHWMAWVGRAPNFNNHKAYVLETLQSRNLKNRFSVRPHCHGPQNSLLWQIVVFWDPLPGNPEYNDEFVKRIINRDFTSPFMPQKKHAEQYCYRKVIEEYLGVSFLFATDLVQGTLTSLTVIEKEIHRYAANVLAARPPLSIDDIKIYVETQLWPNQVTSLQIENVLKNSPRFILINAPNHTVLWSLDEPSN
jgi:hypothetical protein